MKTWDSAGSSASDSATVFKLTTDARPAARSNASSARSVPAQASVEAGSFDYAGARHIPALYEYDLPWVRDGGLMSYGPDLQESLKRAAALTARIFGGARPGDLPFEEPTHYKLVVNLKTAKATGIELPVNFVALADEVIE